MFNTKIFDSLADYNIKSMLVPAPRAAFGTSTKTNEKIGIEIELEKVEIKQELRTVPYWNMVADGSLKVKGQEFILCCYSNKTKQAIKLLKDSLNRSDCSQRTSVHIHLNVDDLNPLQLILFAYYYMIFEIPLIRFSGGRFNNFFCVPLHEWWNGNPDALPRWNKYSAINILPRLHREERSHLATIEFRQMRGNLNEDYIQNWVDIIVKMKQFIKTISVEEMLKTIIEANQTSSYAPMLKTIFKDKADLLYYPEINQDIEKSISRLKLKLYKLGVFKNEVTYSKETGLVDWENAPITNRRMISPVYAAALVIPVTLKKITPLVSELDTAEHDFPNRNMHDDGWGPPVNRLLDPITQQELAQMAQQQQRERIQQVIHNTFGNEINTAPEWGNVFFDEVGNTAANITVTATRDTNRPTTVTPRRNMNPNTRITDPNTPFTITRN